MSRVDELREAFIADYGGLAVFENRLHDIIIAARDEGEEKMQEGPPMITSKKLRELRASFGEVERDIGNDVRVPVAVTELAALLDLIEKQDVALQLMARIRCGCLGLTGCGCCVEAKGIARSATLLEDDEQESDNSPQAKEWEREIKPYLQDIGKLPIGQSSKSGAPASEPRHGAYKRPDEPKPAGASILSEEVVARLKAELAETKAEWHPTSLRAAWDRVKDYDALAAKVAEQAKRIEELEAKLKSAEWTIRETPTMAMMKERDELREWAREVYVWISEALIGNTVREFSPLSRAPDSVKTAPEQADLRVVKYIRADALKREEG